MTEDSEVDADTVEADSEAVSETEAEEETDVVVDLDSAEEYESRIDELEGEIERQREEIEELKDLMVDLSARVADGRGIGVCPECHGPVQKVRRWLGPTTLECRECGEVYHEY